MIESQIGRYQHKERLGLKGSELLVAPSISANALLARTIEEPPALPLSKSPIHFYRFKSNSATEYVGVVDFAVGGVELNHLLLSLAPNKLFGLDTRDILQDWEKIDNDPERKKRHEAMGKPWHIFDRDRLYFRKHIEETFDYRSNRGLIPVIRWRVGYRNIRGLVFDPLNTTQDERFVEILKKHIVNYQDGMDIRFFNPTIGYFAVCHFSPEIKRKWSQKASYSSDCNRTQDMGTTQAGPYAIMQEETIRKSPFYSRAEKYIRLNSRPLAINA